MSAVDQPGSVHFYNKSLGDHLLSPLHSCGRQWNQLRDIHEWNQLPNTKEGRGVTYKTTQVILEALLAIPLILATPFAGAMGIAGSLIKSCSSKQNGSGFHQAALMEPTLKARCQEIGIDNPDLWDHEIEENIAKKLPANLFSAIDVYENTHVFGGKTARVITLSVGRSPPSKTNFSANLHRDLSNCFAKNPSPEEKAYSMEGLHRFLLGMEVTPEQRRELINTIKSSHRINLTISEDLTAFRITLV